MFNVYHNVYVKEFKFRASIVRCVVLYFMIFMLINVNKLYLNATHFICSVGNYFMLHRSRMTNKICKKIYFYSEKNMNKIVSIFIIKLKKIFVSLFAHYFVHFWST